MPQLGTTQQAATSGSATETSGGPGGGLFGYVSNLFASNTTKLKELVDAGHYSAAAKFYAEHRADLDQSKDAAPLLRKTADALNARFAPQMSRLASALEAENPATATPEHWSQLEDEVRRAHRLLDLYGSFELLQEAGYRSPQRQRLLSSLGAAGMRYMAYAPNALARFALSYSGNVLTDYPWIHGLNARTVMAAAYPNIAPALARADVGVIKNFLGRYGDALDAASQAAVKKDLLAAMLRQAAPGGMPTALQAVELLHAFAAVTHDPSQIPFKAEVAVVGAADASGLLSDDLPVAVKSVPIDELGTLAGREDFLYVVEVLQPPPLRKTVQVTTASSRYVSSKTVVQNPKYALAVQAYQNAMAQYQEIKSENAQLQSTAEQNASSGMSGLMGLANVAGSVFGNVSEADAQQKMEQARTVMGETPPTVMQNVYGSYNYTVKTVQVWHPISIVLYALDLRRGIVLSKVITALPSKQFRLVEGLNPGDPDRAAILKQADSGSAVASYMNTSFKDSVSDLLGRLRQGTSAQPLSPGLSGVVAGLRTQVARFDQEVNAQRAALARSQAGGAASGGGSASSSAPGSPGGAVASGVSENAGGASCGGNGRTRSQLVASYRQLAQHFRALSRAQNANARDMGSLNAPGATLDRTGSARGQSDQRGYMEQAGDKLALGAAYADCVATTLAKGGELCAVQQSCKQAAGL